MTFFSGIGVFGHRSAISIPSRGKTGLGTARHGSAAGCWRLGAGDWQLLCLMFYALLHGYKFLLVATTPQMSIYMMTTLHTLCSGHSDSMGGAASWLMASQPGRLCSHRLRTETGQALHYR